MLPLPVSIRALSLAVVAASVIGASSWLGYRQGRADGDREVAKMYRAGVAAVAKRQKQNTDALKEYRDELTAIAAAARKPARVVRLCPDVPQPAGGAAGAPAGGLPGAVGRDIGGDLYALADRADRCAAQLNALIGAVE